MVESLDNLLQPTFIETSALTGHNVEQAFITLIEYFPFFIIFCV